jgi:hypothetical protein
MATEIVTAEPVVNYNIDRHFSVRVLKPFLVGNKWREKGEVVKVPERVAKEAALSGAAEPYGLTAAAAAWFAMPAEVPKSKPAEDYASAKYQAPNIKIVSGSLLQDGKNYGPDDGGFFWRGDVLRHMALTSPEPGSQTEEEARKGSRKLAVIELLQPLSTEQKKRLSRLRKNLYEPTKAEIADAKRLAEIASV